MPNIYLVSFAGYEWNIPHKAFTDKKKADECAAEKNLTKDKEYLGECSEYVVTKVPFVDTK